MPNPSQPAGLPDKQLRELARLIGREVSRSGGGPARAASERELTEGREALAKNYEDLEQFQKRLDRTQRKQELQLKRDVLMGQKSEKFAKRQLKRAKIHQKELDRVIQKETDGRMASANSYRKLAKAQEKFAKQQEREARIAQQTGLRRRLSEKVENERADLIRRRAQARELARLAKEQARDRTQQAAGGIARQGLGKEGLGGDLAGEIVEGFIKGGDPLGVAAGLALVGAMKTYNVQLERARIGRERFLNYGIGSGGRRAGGGRTFATPEEATTAYKKELEAIGRVQTKAGDIATEFNADAEAVMASMTRVATKTGESWETVGDVGRRLAALEYQGLGTLDELTERFLKGNRAFGQNADMALKEMEDIGQDARDIAALTDNVMQMDDFYKAVDEVRSGIDSLTASSRGLSKMLRLQIKLAKNLDMSYEEAVESAKKLTLGLSQSYDQGFATVEVEEDLAGLLADDAFRKEDPERYKRVQQIQQELLSGNILPDMAARFLNEVAGTSSALMRTRLGRATAGEPAAMTEQRLGLQFTSGMYALLRQIERERAAGKDVTALEADLAQQAVKAQEERAGYDRRLAATKETEFDVSKAAAAGLRNVLDNTVGAFSSLVDKIRGAAEAIADKFGLSSAPTGPVTVPPPSATKTTIPTAPAAPAGAATRPSGTASWMATPTTSVSATGGINMTINVPANVINKALSVQTANTASTGPVGNRP